MFATVVRNGYDVESKYKYLSFASYAPRRLSITNVHVHLQLVGRPGLDPGTLGLKETSHRLWCVDLAAHFNGFQGIVS